MIDKYMLLYEGNKEFHDYVERLMRPGKRDCECKLSDILQKKTVQDIGDYYLRKSGGLEQSPFSPVSQDLNCDCDDKSC